MGTRLIILSIEPSEVLDALIAEVDGDVLHYEYHRINKDVSFGTVVVENLESQGNCPVTLILSVENTEGMTRATIITTTKEEDWEMILERDPGDEVADRVMEMLEKFIIDTENL